MWCADKWWKHLMSFVSRTWTHPDNFSSFLTSPLHEHLFNLWHVLCEVTLFMRAEWKWRRSVQSVQRTDERHPLVQLFPLTQARWRMKTLGFFVVRSSATKIQVTWGDATVVAAGSEKLVRLGSVWHRPRNPLGVTVVLLHLISCWMTSETEGLLNSYSLIAAHVLYFVLN